MSFEVVWVVYALIGAGLFAAAFLWAVRAGQFRHQDRARYLPLQSPPEEPKTPDRNDAAEPDAEHSGQDSESEI